MSDTASAVRSLLGPPSRGFEVALWDGSVLPAGGSGAQGTSCLPEPGRGARCSSPRPVRCAPPRPSPPALLDIEGDTLGVLEAAARWPGPPLQREVGARRRLPAGGSGCRRRSAPAARPPPLAGARPLRGPVPLRRLGRVLPTLPRALDGLLLRLLCPGRRVAGGGPGGEARAGLPEAGPAPGGAASRRRLRLGRAGAPCGAALRRRRPGHHPERAPAGRGSRPAGGACPHTTWRSAPPTTGSSANELALRQGGQHRDDGARRLRAARRLLRGDVPRHQARWALPQPRHRRAADAAATPFPGCRGTGGGFIRRYIFPDSELIPVARVVEAAERAGFEVRDLESLREHYAETLAHWLHRLEERFEEAVRLVGEERARAWRLYLASSSVAFRLARDCGLPAAPASARARTAGASVPRTRERWYAAPRP